jgi:hypothetical protein
MDGHNNPSKTARRKENNKRLSRILKKITCEINKIKWFVEIKKYKLIIIIIK